MSGEETRVRLQQMRDKAREYAEAAERTSDPDERQRLQEKSRRLQSQCEQEGAMRGGDIYPSE
ncbi:DUF6381 family protein [Streptomyces sp. NPDC001233]|uniref:DUF6381 family protein n=1 Tax=Streptomyces sp. NPDC002589 TaxID=3154420 RepID=UPI0033288E99